jgi:hypothetical protein
MRCVCDVEKSSQSYDAPVFMYVVCERLSLCDS